MQKASSNSPKSDSMFSVNLHAESQNPDSSQQVFFMVS